ncbi:hypothetical protein HHI36_012753 [Cryptolaemus montrouzieri]|uniref:Uncharacterized protein n=1 Tax=Cryptolaemus montrouzieri TaxID=559131 RepID=A0ABD2NFQ1_9CUCU
MVELDLQKHVYGFVHVNLKLTTTLALAMINCFTIDNVTFIQASEVEAPFFFLIFTLQQIYCRMNDMNGMIGKKILMDKEIQTEDASTNMCLDEILLQQKLLDEEEHIESLEEEVLKQRF